MMYDKILAIYKTTRGEIFARARNAETKQIEFVDITLAEFNLFRNYLPVVRRSVYRFGEYIEFGQD